MTTKTKTLAVVLGLALMAAYPMEASANQYTVSDGEREHYEETLRDLGYKDGVGHSDADIAKIAKDIIRANPSKLTDDPNVTPRYIKPICGKENGHTFFFGYGGINIGSKGEMFHASYRGSDSKVFQKSDYYPELYMYNATIANDLAHEMGHWYQNNDEHSMAKEDEADNYAMEFTEPLEYGSYAGQWLSYNSVALSEKATTTNHKDLRDDAQDALDYIEKASKGHIKFLGDGRGSFSTFKFDNVFFLRENTTLYGTQSVEHVYPFLPKDSDKWNDFVVDEKIKRNGIKEAFNPDSDYHVAYVAAQIAFAIKYNVFDMNHTHVMDAWTFWHDGESVTPENQQHHDTLSKWTVLYFDNPLNGGRKIVDIYPYTAQELPEKAEAYLNLVTSAPSDGDEYVKWCKDNWKTLNYDTISAYVYFTAMMNWYNNHDK